jgi:hypothetical protein
MMDAMHIVNNPRPESPSPSSQYMIGKAPIAQNPIVAHIVGPSRPFVGTLYNQGGNPRFVPSFKQTRFNSSMEVLDSNLDSVLDQFNQSQNKEASMVAYRKSEAIVAYHRNLEATPVKPKASVNLHEGRIYSTGACKLDC